jgi:hypothetical protein
VACRSAGTGRTNSGSSASIQAAHAAERDLERLNKERAALAARLADGATYALAGTKIAALIRREAELKAAIEAAEHRWLAAAEAWSGQRRRCAPCATPLDR